uniref:Uncharacterized protein n=1 Tax=Oryza meridionalis TaxID=40149 RepID=A0A0E0DBH3_9ORYZ
MAGRRWPMVVEGKEEVLSIEEGKEAAVVVETEELAAVVVEGGEEALGIKEGGEAAVLVEAKEEVAGGGGQEVLGIGEAAIVVETKEAAIIVEAKEKAAVVVEGKEAFSTIAFGPLKVDVKTLVLMHMSDVNKVEVEAEALPHNEGLHIVKKVSEGIEFLRSLKKLWLLNLHKDFNTYSKRWNAREDGVWTRDAAASALLSLSLSLALPASLSHSPDAAASAPPDAMMDPSSFAAAVLAAISSAGATVAGLRWRGDRVRYYIVTYALGIYILNLLIAFLSPQDDPEQSPRLLRIGAIAHPLPHLPLFRIRRASSASLPSASRSSAASPPTAPSTRIPRLHVAGVCLQEENNPLARRNASPVAGDGVNAR